MTLLPEASICHLTDLLGRRSANQLPLLHLQPYHPTCHRELFGERCVVCRQLFPSEVFILLMLTFPCFLYDPQALTSVNLLVPSRAAFYS